MAYARRLLPAPQIELARCAQVRATAHSASSAAAHGAYTFMLSAQRDARLYSIAVVAMAPANADTHTLSYYAG